MIGYIFTIPSYIKIPTKCKGKGDMIDMYSKVNIKIENT